MNGCCWLNHNDKVYSKIFIETVRKNHQIKGWFSGHFHLSHDYEDSITFPGGNNRGSCVFAQTGVMTARSSRDGRRHSRLVRGNENGFEVPPPGTPPPHPTHPLHHFLVCTPHKPGGDGLGETCLCPDWAASSAEPLSLTPVTADWQNTRRCPWLPLTLHVLDAVLQVCTVDHSKGGEVRLDATVVFSDQCIIDEDGSQDAGGCSSITYAHPHEDFDHDKWFSAYLPEEGDGRYVGQSPRGVLDFDFTNRDPVCWWRMSDGAVLGGHNGMIFEYDPSTLAPLGMVVSRDELLDRKVAVIDDEWGNDTLILFGEDDNVTVVQPNEDGSYWRKVVRNKMHRMWEMRRVAAAKNWIKDVKGEEGESAKVLSSYGPYITTAGQVMGISTKAVDPKAVVQV